MTILKSLKAKHNLLYFAKEICGWDKIDDEVHKPLCKKLQDSSLNKKLILMPRGSYKSTIGSISYPLWRLWRNPNIRILIDSETFQNSVKYIELMSTIITQNALFKNVVGHIYPKKYQERWSSSEITVTTRTAILKEPTVSAGSVDVTKVGMHYDLIVCDDLVSDQNINTKEQVDKVIQHFKLLFSLLEPEGEMIVIGTRWTYGDLYDYIISELKDEFNITIEQATKEDGSLFFPRILSKKFLDLIRKIMGPSLYACQYQNEIIAKEAQMFKDLSIYEQLPSVLTYTITLDPAISLEKSADFSAFVVCATDYRNIMYVVDALQGKFTPKQLMDTFFILNRVYHPQIFGVEAGLFDKMIAYTLKEEMIRRDEYIPIEPIKTHNVPKETRIAALHPRILMGTMLFKKGLNDLEDQLLRYPKIKHDDLLDALAMQLEIHHQVSVDAPQSFAEDKKEIDLMLRRLTPPLRRRRPTQYPDPVLGSEF